MTERSAALAVGWWLVLASVTFGQPVNPFAAPSGGESPAASPTPAPATGVVNPFAASPAVPSGSAPSDQPAAPSGGVTNPFAGPAESPSPGQPSPSGPGSPFQPGEPGAAPTPTPAAAAAPPPQPDLSTISPDTPIDELGLSPADRQREIEKSKDRVTEFYARGEYDKALREIEFLEKLSPGEPKAVLVRQRINERLLQGKPIGRPLREEFDQPVPTSAPPEETEVAGPIGPSVEGPGPETPPVEATAPPPPEPPVAQPPVAAGESKGMKVLLPLVVGAALLILVIVAVVFFFTRRSRRRVQEAMAMARTSMAEQPLGAPAFPAPSPFQTEEQPPPPPPVFAAPEPPAAVAASQDEDLYDLPTMILTEEQMEAEARSEAAPSSPPAPAGDPFAAPDLPPLPEPEAPEPAKAQQYGSPSFHPPPMPSETEAPEVHQTDGGTFQPYGSTGRAVGEVVSGAPPPSLEPPPADSPLSPPEPAYLQPPERAFSASPQETDVPDSFAADDSKLQLPDIFAADGTEIPAEEVEARGKEYLDPDEASDAARFGGMDFLSSAASLPIDSPGPQPQAPASPPAPGTPSSMGSAQEPPSYGTGGGDLALDDLLFATGGASDTEMQTRGQSSPGGDAPESGSGSQPASDDLTQMSFGKEFDRLMFAQPDQEPGAGADQTLAGDTLTGGETLASPSTPGLRQEDDTLLDALRPGPGTGEPMPAGGEDQTVMTNLSPGAAPGTPPATPSAAGPSRPPSQPTTPLPPVGGLDATAKLPPATAPKGAPGAGEEALFNEDRRKGLEAFDAADWKQAVHFLSVAASIHPEDKEVCQKLQEARKQRRSAAGI